MVSTSNSVWYMISTINLSCYFQHRTKFTIHQRKIQSTQCTGISMTHKLSFCDFYIHLRNLLTRRATAIVSIWQNTEWANIDIKDLEKKQISLEKVTYSPQNWEILKTVWSLVWNFLTFQGFGFFWFDPLSANQGSFLCISGVLHTHANRNYWSENGGCKKNFHL